MKSVDQLAAELLKLPSLERGLLAEKLVESLEFDTDPEIQSAWLSVAQKRSEQIINGVIKTIPGDDALAQVRQLLDS